MMPRLIAPLRCWLLGFLLFSLFGRAICAGTGSDTLTELENQWSHALVKPDLGVLQHLMDERLTYGHSSGKLEGKRSYIDRIANGEQKYLMFAYDPGSMKVRIEGHVGFVTATAHVRSITDGKSNSPHLLLLHIWLRRHGRWMLVAHQSTALPN